MTLLRGDQYGLNHQPASPSVAASTYSYSTRLGETLLLGPHNIPT